MKNKKIVLIDGSSLLSTNFYATIDNGYYYTETEEEKEKFYEKLLKTKEGKYINGVFGMTRTINTMFRRVKPTHIAIAWDVSRETTFRKKLYPEYKGQRGKTPHPLKEQYQTGWEFFEKLGIAQFKYNEYEADDIIGTLAHQFNNVLFEKTAYKEVRFDEKYIKNKEYLLVKPTRRLNNQIFIWSKDQDLLQLVNDTTRMWLMTSKHKEMMEEMGVEKEMIGSFNIPDGVFEHTPLTIQKFYDLKPKQIIDMKAIEGDSSDNISGIKGIGEKTIIPLLQEFKTIEGIYNFLETATVKEAKSMFKDLGIRSPINKLMHKIEYDDLIFILSTAIMTLDEESSSRILYNEAIGINTNSIDVVELNNYLSNLKNKELKTIFKNIKKCSKKDNQEIYNIVSKLGTYIKDEAYKNAFLFKKLTTIKTDIKELDVVELDDLKHDYENKKDAVFKEYQFKSLL